MSSAGSRYPAEFSSWPPEERVNYFATCYSRAGLIAFVLGHAGRDVELDDLDSDYRLTKPELSAIFLRLEGYQ